MGGRLVWCAAAEIRRWAYAGPETEQSGTSGSSEKALVRRPLTRPTATLSRGARGRGAVSGLFGQLAPHPAYGHPLPGGEGSRSGLGFVWSFGPLTRPAATLSRGARGRGLRPGFVWSCGPSPGLRPPSPGGEGSRIVSRVCLVIWPLTRPAATLSRGARGRGLRPGFVWSFGPLTRPAATLSRGRGVEDCVPGLFGRRPLTRPAATLSRGRGVEVRSRVPLEIATNHSAGLPSFPIFMREGDANVMTVRFVEGDQGEGGFVSSRGN